MNKELLERLTLSMYAVALSIKQELRSPTHAKLDHVLVYILLSVPTQNRESQQVPTEKLQ